MVWDSGGENGLSDLGRRLMGVLPPMHDLAKLTGLDLPEYLGKIAEPTDSAASEDTPPAATEASSDVAGEGEDA